MDAETIDAYTIHSAPTVFPIGLKYGGKGGKGGIVQLTNDEFIETVFTAVPEGAYVGVCSKEGNPVLGGWSAHRADQAATELTETGNNYVGCPVSIWGTMGLSRRVKPSLPPAIS